MKVEIPFSKLVFELYVALFIDRKTTAELFAVVFIAVKVNTSVTGEDAMSRSISLATKSRLGMSEIS